MIDFILNDKANISYDSIKQGQFFIDVDNTFCQKIDSEIYIQISDKDGRLIGRLIHADMRDNHYSIFHQIEGIRF
jgi:hypothetical protein